MSNPSIITTLALGLASLVQAADPVPAQEVRIGYQVVSNILLLGKAKGYFEEEFANAGVDPSHNALIVLKGSSIADAKSLKGKKVAVQVGSSAHHFLFALLAKNGLSPSDVQVVNLPAPELAKTLEKGDVDAISIWEPYATNILQSGKERLLADSRGIKRGITVYLVRNEFGKQNPKLVQAFLRSVKRSIDLEKADPVLAAKAISAESKFPAPVITEVLGRYDFGLPIQEADVQALSSVKDFLRDTKVLRKDFYIADLFDPSYLAASGLK